jgi:hypothetical protein
MNRLQAAINRFLGRGEKPAEGGHTPGTNDEMQAREAREDFVTEHERRRDEEEASDTGRYDPSP